MRLWLADVAMLRKGEEMVQEIDLAKLVSITMVDIGAIHSIH